jgi:hypothetical protein
MIIITEYGTWTIYCMDGAITTENVDSAYQEPAGTGFRAAFEDSVHDGDYDWGPLASTAEEAIRLFLEERVQLGIDANDEDEE